MLGNIKVEILFKVGPPRVGAIINLIE